MLNQQMQGKITAELQPNPEFAKIASDEVIRRTAAALQANGFHTIVVENAEEARKKLHELLPSDAEVFDATSQTLEVIGFTKELHAGDIPYNAIKPQLYKMDRNTQMREIRKLGAAPDYVVGSVHAITEDGTIVAASASGSQLGPYVSGAGNVIFAVGAQKIVPDLDTAFRRIYEYSFPKEDARARAAYNMASRVAKLLVLNSERPGRITVVLIKQELGF